MIFLCIYFIFLYIFNQLAFKIILAAAFKTSLAFSHGFFLCHGWKYGLKIMLPNFRLHGSVRNPMNCLFIFKIFFCYFRVNQGDVLVRNHFSSEIGANNFCGTSALGNSLNSYPGSGCGISSRKYSFEICFKGSFLNCYVFLFSQAYINTATVNFLSYCSNYRIGFKFYKLTCWKGALSSRCILFTKNHLFAP